MLFNDIRFPEDISYGSMGGPEFSTDIIETGSGYEQRKINWSYPKARYNIIYGVKSDSQLSSLIKFFYICKGKAIAFRFKDWSDYQVTKQKVGTADGQQKDFQLIKSYSIDDITYNRIINKPVKNTVKIYLNNSLQNNNYEIDSKGYVKFSIAPEKNTNIYADFEFDIPVRFDTDHLSFSIDDYKNHSCHNISLVEVRI